MPPKITNGVPSAHPASLVAAQIRGHEAFMAKEYDDGAGNTTIGYGLINPLGALHEAASLMNLSAKAKPGSGVLSAGTWLGPTPPATIRAVQHSVVKLAGFGWPGHTEMLADLTGTRDVRMLLVTDRLKVVHVTTHRSLRSAIDAATHGRIVRTIELAQEGARQLGVVRPRIAVAGLNPHAGEGGLFGDEEARDITPAVADACAAGIDASGPWAPDTLFWRASQGEFDVVVAMYHDQGHIPVKLGGFDEGVNVTLGLPFPRASVDHGTAFDIAGKGIARWASMAAAIRVAAQLARAWSAA